MPAKCPTHQPPRVKGAKRHGERASAAKRGYDRQWQRFRRWFLGANPVCADCKREAAVDVHHKVPLSERPDLRCVEDNCVALCHACHSRRTMSVFDPDA